MKYRFLDYILPFCTTAILCFLAITNDSIWIDEGWSAWPASVASMEDFVQDTMLGTRNSIAQTPLHNLYLWGWARLFGMSEVSLRGSNVPFLLLFFFALQTGSIRLFGSRWGWMILAASPFLWFYVNEARPYIAVMAFTTIATLSLLFYINDTDLQRPWAPWICIFSCFILCAVHMLCVFLIPAIIAGLLVGIGYKRPNLQEIFRDWFYPALLFLPLFLCLGGFYGWTLWQGTQGARGNPGIQNSAFMLYEFTGFLGLGPPRNILRYAPSESAREYVGTLFLGISGWAVVIGAIIMKIRYQGIPKTTILLCTMIATGFFFYISIAWPSGQMFWGRHFTFLFPLFAFVIISLLKNDHEKKSHALYRRMAIACLVSIWLLSAMRLTYLEEYRRDDYRGAVSHVIDAAGETGTILWSASIQPASYYGLQFDNVLEQISHPTARRAESVSNWNQAQLETAFQESAGPVIVALSRPDWFDRKNIIENWVATRNGVLIAQLNAFKIYEIP